MPQTTTRPTPAASSPSDPDLPSLGKWICPWIEQNLVHGEGDYLGEPFLLEDWQRRIIYDLYVYDPETYKRVVRRALWIFPKGCGKTALIGAICNAELDGPVDPSTIPTLGVPSPRKAPNIPIAAASLQQANNLFGAARIMRTQGPLKDAVDAYDVKILLRDRLGQMFRVAAEAGTNDGGLPTCFAADELHEWEGRKARVHLVIGNSLAKRDQGLELNISTPDDADPDSLLGRLVAYGEKVASGEVTDPSFHYIRYSASPDVDLDDPQALRNAIRAATPASWVDVERVAARYEIDRIPEHEFRRYHLAQFVRPSTKWLPTKAWDALAAPKEVTDGDEICVGFDGSYNNDSTAMWGCRVSDGHLFKLGVWEKPPNAPDTWVVPRAEVEAKLHETMSKYRVVELAPDTGPYGGWHREIQEWEAAYGEDVVVGFPTNSTVRMAAACSRFFTAVLNGQLSHDDDPTLTRHLNNAVVKETRDGAVITKDGRNSPRKIDAAVAAVVAYERATWRREQTPQPGIYIYEDE